MSLRTSTGRSNRASARRSSPKSKGATPISRPCASTARTVPFAGASASLRVSRAARAPASLSIPAMALAPLPPVTTSTECVSAASPAANPPAPPSSTPSAIHKTSAFGSDARNCPIAGSAASRAGAKGTGASERSRPTIPAMSSGTIASAPCDRGLMATTRPARAAASILCLANSTRFSKAGAAAQPSSMRTRSGPEPARPARLFHNGPAIARMISAPIARRSARIGQGVRAGSVSLGSRPIRSRSGGNNACRGLGGVTRKRK